MGELLLALSGVAMRSQLARGNEYVVVSGFSLEFFFVSFPGFSDNLVLEISGFRVFAVSKKTSCAIMARVSVLTRNECVSLSHSFPCLVLDTLRALHRVRFSFPTHLPLFYLIYKLVDHASSLYLLASSVLRPFPAGLQPSWRL